MMNPFQAPQPGLAHAVLQSGLLARLRGGAWHRAQAPVGLRNFGLKLLGLALAVALTLVSLAWASAKMFYEIRVSPRLMAVTSGRHEAPDQRLLWKLRVQALAAEQERKDLVGAGRLPDEGIEILTPGLVGPQDWPLRRVNGAITFYWPSADLGGALVALSVALAQGQSQVTPLDLGRRRREFLFEIVLGTSPNGKAKVIGGFDADGLRSLRLATGKAALRLPRPAGDAMTDAQFSRDGRYVALGASRELLLYDTRTRQPYAYSAGLAEPRRLAVGFDPAGRALAWFWADADGKVQLSTTALPPTEKYRTETFKLKLQPQGTVWPAYLPRPQAAGLPAWVEQSGG